MDKGRFTKRRRFIQPRKCSFCQESKEPDYKETDLLRRFTTSRGKIVSRDRSGACSKHQKKLRREIKRSRFLALLPFITKP
ncbi:MAG TPA: 30S ribosomal protein S18 [Candidatus Bathyarchaeia archaeon]|nr:30S ribosomal protein S18 [Candidatus Bathyarchaeia archaeon]